MKKKVALGMSGGVDSSVSAKILLDAGYDVVGLFLKLWFDPKCSTSRENACCDEKALMDAQTVADQLGIKLYVVDVRKEFKDSIVDYFVEEYAALRTPNPCVLCNKKIKFGWMWDFAKKIECEYVATGHYARIEDSAELSVTTNHQLQTAKYFRLLKGIDNSKDQSYFLYQLSQDQLSHVLFPVGNMTKAEVRGLAKEWGLPVFEKVESQEICFIDTDYREFLKLHLPAEYFLGGKIVDKSGYTVGTHDGLINYTIGQRKGVNQELRITNNGKDKEPLYVIGVDKEKNQLIVGDESDLYKSEMRIGNVNWINPDFESKIANGEGLNLSVKIRYRAQPVECIIKPNIDHSQFIIQFATPQRAIAPGQSAVFHIGDEVVGGGVIS